MTDPAPTEAKKSPAAKRSRGGSLLRRENVRPAVAGLLAVLLTLFAVFNLDQVEVNWLLGTWETPLIVVVAVSALVGMGIDRILVRRSRAAATERRPAKRA